MQKAMFFEEAYKKGVLAKIESGYILSMTTPDLNDLARQHDPFLFEMVSYSGVKSIIDIGNGVKFQAQGRKTYCMLEPATYAEKHVDPTFRSSNTTGHMPFRFDDCDQFLTKDSKFNILIPSVPFNCYDTFTISFPGKGDICILYFIFDQDVEGKVMPFIKDNFRTILSKSIGIRNIDAKSIAEKYVSIVHKFDVRLK